MKKHVLILGAGFGGLELAKRLSETLEDAVRVTLLDRNDAFVFGFSKLEVMLGRQSADAVRLPYSSIEMDGVEFRQETVTGIDPGARRVATDSGSYDADFLVVAMGADYDMDATPGFAASGFEYYTVAGAERLRDALTGFDGGRVLVSVLGQPFKCPPAPFEGAFLLHECFTQRGIRGSVQMTSTFPMQRPVPVTGEVSEHGDQDASAVEPGQRVAQPFGARDRVVLEAARREAGRRVHVVVGAHGHDEEVRVVGAGVRGHPPGGGVDAGHRLLAELDTLLVDVAVVQPHLVGGLPAEHHLELGEAEHERVVAVQQRDADRVLERLGEPRRQLQATEARAEDQDVLLHRTGTLLPPAEPG